MKTIRISYFTIDENWENSIMEISLTPPLYKSRRRCYMYELFYFDNLVESIQDEELKNIQYGVIGGNNVPLYIKVKDDVFKDIKKFLEETTDYEKAKSNDDISLLSAILNIYRNDPKSWEV